MATSKVSPSTISRAESQARSLKSKARAAASAAAKAEKKLDKLKATKAKKPKAKVETVDAIFPFNAGYDGGLSDAVRAFREAYSIYVPKWNYAPRWTDETKSAVYIRIPAWEARSGNIHTRQRLQPT
jgi:hypothetical protein